MSNLYSRILAAITNEPLTYRQIAEIVGMRHKDVAAHLAVMVRKDYVYKYPPIGPCPVTGRWSIRYGLGTRQPK